MLRELCLLNEELFITLSRRTSKVLHYATKIIYSITSLCTLKKVNCWEPPIRSNQQPIKGSPKEFTLWSPEKVQRLSLRGVGRKPEALLLGKLRRWYSPTDEVDYWLYPQEVKQLVPLVEQLWLEPGRRIFPDVKLKCESSLSLYWDKGGVEWNVKFLTKIFHDHTVKPVLSWYA